MGEEALESGVRPPDGEPDEGNKWYERDFSAEFDGLLGFLTEALDRDPDRLRKPDEYVAMDLDWSAASVESLRRTLTVDFGDPDTAIGLAIDHPREFGIPTEELQGHARSACRAILDLEAVADTVGEAELANSALTLAARYADFYGLPVSGRTRVRQRELGLRKGE